MPIQNFFVLIFVAVSIQKEKIFFLFFLIVTKTKIKTRKLAFGFQSPADATKETCFFDTIFG